MTAEDPSGRPVDTPPTDDSTNSAGPAALAGDDSAKLLWTTVEYPAVGVCVVTVEGELDLLTAPLLDVCMRQQFTAAPTHLILNLEPVTFMGSKGLNCLLQARELAQQTPGTHLHLAGLVTRVVARPLEVTALLELFDIYPTLPDALAAMVD